MVRLFSYLDLTTLTWVHITEMSPSLDGELVRFLQLALERNTHPQPTSSVLSWVLVCHVQLLSLGGLLCFEGKWRVVDQATMGGIWWELGVLEKGKTGVRM